jgi:hypothetical protein
MKSLTRKRLAPIVRQLQEIRRTSTMKDALFGCPGDNDLTTLIKSETELWRESWLIDPLDHIIKELSIYLGSNPDDNQHP